MNTKKRAAFHNLGCKVNSYETEAMLDSLSKEGYEIVPFESEADVYIVNTCSVTNIADRKSRQMLHRAKANNPDAVVVAVGCYVQAVGEEILKDSGVDIAIGNDKKMQLAGILSEYFSGQGECFVSEDIGKSCDYENMHIESPGEHTRAVIKVQDGCNQFCTYCIIPYTRGRIRSRDKADVYEEVKALARKGVKEVVLTGIHLSSYGLDELKKTGDYGGQTFAVNYLYELIKGISEIDGIERIRLGSLEPRIITEETAMKLASIDKLCPHFHLSLQSGCDSVLKRMNRHYSTQLYKEKCDILRRAFDNPAITTDVIVGFPGETEEEFEETRRYLEELKLYEMHIFKYSMRKGTIAASMKEQVPEQLKTQRSKVLLRMTGEQSEEYRKSWLNKEVSVLWEDDETVDGREYITGYTKEYIRVCCPKSSDSPKSGTITKGILSGLIRPDLVLLEIPLESNGKMY